MKAVKRALVRARGKKQTWKNMFHDYLMKTEELTSDQIRERYIVERQSERRQNDFKKSCGSTPPPPASKKIWDENRRVKRDMDLFDIKVDNAIAQEKERFEKDEWRKWEEMKRHEQKSFKTKLFDSEIDDSE